MLGVTVSLGARWFLLTVTPRGNRTALRASIRRLLCAGRDSQLVRGARGVTVSLLAYLQGLGQGYGQVHGRAPG